MARRIVPCGGCSGSESVSWKEAQFWPHFMPLERPLFLHATREHNNNAAIIMWNSSRAGLLLISPSRARVRQPDAALRILESWVAASVHRTSCRWNCLTVGRGCRRQEIAEAEEREKANPAPFAKDAKGCGTRLVDLQLPPPPRPEA